MNLPHSWFYQGFLAGLSSKEDPVIMATFNTEFYKHTKWLEEQHIYLQHLPVIMLSKLKKYSDFSLIKQLTQENDGVWFNRISRLEEPRDPRLWRWDYGLEVSPLATKDFNDYLWRALKPLK